MSTVPYAHLVQGPAVVQPIGPAVIMTPRRGINPLIPMCCVGLILFLIASTIILALIPVYLSTRNMQSSFDTISYNTLYRLNNGTLPLGALSADNCAVFRADQQNLASSNRGVSSSTPIIVDCTVTGNTTVSRRRRRQSQVPEGNLISINGRLSGNSNCPRSACFSRRAQRFLALLLNCGTFFLILTANNGTRFVFSTAIISASIVPAQSAASINDIAILNYALVLEQLESNFYTTFQARFTAQNFIAAGFSQQTYDYFNIIYVHELAHVRTLTAIISQLGGIPVSPCTYNFSVVTDVPSYISVAKTLENTGAMAYDGAVNGIASPTLRQTAATVATVEARHASYLNSLNNVIPFPTAFENATVPTIIIQAIQQFIISCPFTITAPTVPYIGSSSFTGTVPTSNNAAVTPYTNAMYTNDLKALNYALVAEHLESTFYNTYVSTYTSSDYTSNGFPDVSSYFIMIREIENAHVQFLQMTITQRSGTPVSYCTYNFNVANIVDFIHLSRTFENTGVSAYDGAINRIHDPNLIMGAATIATVEARFASFLNGLLGDVPFPNITDLPLEPAQIVTILSTYQTCPFIPDLPIIF